MASKNYPSSRWLRWLWSANAVLLFAVLLTGLYSFVFPYGRGSDGGVEPIPVRSGEPSEERPRAVRMSLPFSVLGGDTRLVEVRYGDGFASQFGIDGSRSRADPIVNIMFLQANGSAHALLTQPGFISNRLVPNRGADSLQAWLAFAVATQDTNGDGVLDDLDLTQILMTDLDGGNPRSVFESPRRVTGMGRIGTDLAISYLLASSDPSAREEELPERLAVYRFESEVLDELDQVSSTLEGIERVLAR